MIELPLDQVPPTVDAVHDLEMTAALVAADLLQEAHEMIGFPVMSDRVQRGKREGRIPQPNESIIPVSYSPDRLRERRGRCRDHRASLGVGEQLEGKRGALDHTPKGTPVFDLGRPLLPERGCVVQLTGALVAAGGMNVVV